ncbi:Stage II sporulation protein M [compost metagenome]
MFALVSVAPHNMVVIPALLITSVAAVGFSLGIIRNRVLMNTTKNVARPFLSYTGLTLAMAGVLLAVSSFETWVTPVMMSWVTPLIT